MQSYANGRAYADAEAHTGCDSWAHTSGRDPTATAWTRRALD